MKFRMIIVTILAVLGTAGMERAAMAQSHGEGEHQRPWEVMIGAGAMAEMEYSGSDEIGIAPLPFMYATYSTQYIDLFIHVEDGIGVKMNRTFWDTLPTSLAFSVGLGTDSRDNSLALLKGMPELTNSYQLRGDLSFDLPTVKLTARGRYIPISAEYDNNMYSDADYDGVVVELEASKEMWLREWLMIEVGGGMSWMNDEYADANYSIAHSTAKLGAFQAGSGMQDVNASLMVITFFSEHVGIAMMGELSYLLNDAADSPLTQQKAQPFGGVFALYRF